MQLFSTNAFSANTFSLNVLPSFTDIYSQSIVSTNNFFTYFYQRKQISRRWHRSYQDQTNSFRVIRLEALVLNVLVLMSCAVWLEKDVLSPFIKFKRLNLHQESFCYKFSLISFIHEVIIWSVKVWMFDTNEKIYLFSKHLLLLL